MAYSYSFGSASELVLSAVTLTGVDMPYCIFTHGTYSYLTVTICEIISVTVTVLGPYSIVPRINNVSVYATIVI